MTQPSLLATTWLLGASAFLLPLSFWMWALAWPRFLRASVVGAAIGTVSTLAGHKKDGDTSTEAVLKTAIEGATTGAFAATGATLGGACLVAAEVCSPLFAVGFGAFGGWFAGKATSWADAPIGWTQER